MKIKIKSLAVEAKTIRHEENKTRWRGERHRLYCHRTWTVRHAAREAQLAYAFIRGVPYRAVESTSHTQANVRKVGRLVYQYGVWHPGCVREDILKARLAEKRKEVLAWMDDEIDCQPA